MLPNVPYQKPALYSIAGRCSVPERKQRANILRASYYYEQFLSLKLCLCNLYSRS